MRDVLFKTHHGSRLYGLNHAGSDEDYYTVVAKKPVDTRYDRQERSSYSTHKIVDGVDSVVVDFGTWVEQCKFGVPQALEAMFSDMSIGEDKIADFRRQFRAGSQCWDRYLRTIKSFALNEDNTMKTKRHALRLAFNFNQMVKTGRFNPTLSRQHRYYSEVKATTLCGVDVYNLALEIAWR